MENMTDDDTGSSSVEDLSERPKHPQNVRISIDELQQDFAFIDWSKLMTLFSEVSGFEITELLLDSKEYLDEMMGLFSRHRPRTIDNFFCWSSIARFMPYLGPQFRRLYTDFRREVPDLSSPGSEPKTESGRVFLSRWKECVHLTCEGLKLPTSLLYLQHKHEYLDTSNHTITTMIQNIKKAFHKIVDQQSWLPNEQTKQLLKERADKIGSKIGFPSFLRDPQEADKYYSSLRIEPADVFVSNIIKIARNEMVMELRKLNETVDPDKEWLIQPLIANAYFDAANDYIILPAGILRFPLVSNRRPKFLDYSTLGVVIGHEIAHSFDALTRKESDANGDGNLTWWPSELDREYDNLTKCFVDQFSSYVVASTGENLNGNATLDENLCDFAGFQQSYAAFHSLGSSQVNYDQRLPGLQQFTVDQLFFVQYAQMWCEVSSEDGHRKSVHDSHSPGRYRTIGIAVNSPQFGNVFDCPRGSPMNPIDKCKLWIHS